MNIHFSTKCELNILLFVNKKGKKNTFNGENEKYEFVFSGDTNFDGMPATWRANVSNRRYLLPL